MDKRMTAAETWDAAKEEIARLRAYISELESAAQTEYEEGLKIGWSHELENNKLRARVAELEAAQAWRPASEPPKDTRDTIIALAGDVGAVYAVGHYRPLQKLWQVRQAAYETATVLGWRELPPMPETGK